MAKRGKFIVIEGADGSGKTTQSKFLASYFSKNKIPNSYVSFPRYESSMWAAMVRRYLLGDFGKLEDVDPYFGSMLYAGDRASAKDEINKWLDSGRAVIANRYSWSNAAHMGAKFKNLKDRKKYLDWLEKLEYGENNIPKEDIVVFLYVPISVTKKLMGGRNLDIHEKDLVYQEKVLEVYEQLADSKKNWIKIDCTQNGKILSQQVIHTKILEALKAKNLI